MEVDEDTVSVSHMTDQFTTPARAPHTPRQRTSVRARSTQRPDTSTRSRTTPRRASTRQSTSSGQRQASPSSAVRAAAVTNSMRFFEMPKKRVKAYWQFIVLVAHERYATVPDDALKIEHAKYGWCQRCNTKVDASKGRNDAGPHMKRCHPEDLAAYRQREERRRTQRAARRLVNIYEPAHLENEGVAEPASEADQSHFVALIVQWIASSMRPLNIVADPGLIAAIQFACSVPGGLHLPSRQTATTQLQIRAGGFRSSLRIRIGDSAECFFYSVSSDIWTSLCAESFISFTLHYLDEQFNMHKWTLEVMKIPGKHDAPAIAAALLRCFELWRLDRAKCVRFLRDGASNMKKACKQIRVTSMSCVAHSLHLVVGAALIRKPTDLELTTSVDDVRENNMSVVNVDSSDHSESTGSSTSDVSNDDSESDDNESDTQSHGQSTQAEADEDSDSDERIDPDEVTAICEQVAEFVQDCEMASDDLVRQTVRRFRKLAEYFRRSPKGTNRLEVLQGGRKNAVKVKIDSPTRWNSTMDMLQRMIRLRPAFEDFFTYLCSPNGSDEFDDVSQSLNRPTSEEWFVIQCLLKLLEPFSAVTDHLGGETYPTLVSVHASIRTLKLLLSDQEIFDDLYAQVKREPFADRVIATMKSVRRCFVTLIEKRFEEIDDDVMWISLLDPYFTNSSLLSDAETKRAKVRLKQEMIAFGRSMASEEREQHEAGRAVSTTPIRCTASFQKVMYGSRLKTRRAPSRTRTQDEECDWELKNYLRTSSTAQADEEELPSSLDWWRENAKTFPRIAPLARKWLGCIATSVPSERAFSTAGNTITKRRSALSADTVRDILFMAENTTS